MTFPLVLLCSHSHDSCLIYKRKLELSSSSPHHVPTVSCGDGVICHQLGPFLFSCRDNRATVWVSAFLLRSHLSDPAPTIAPSKNPVLGFHGWDETVTQGSVYLVSSFFLGDFFFPLALIFFVGLFFLVPPSWNPIFFLGTRTYSSNLPTSLPSTTQPIYLPPSHLHSLSQCSSCHHHRKRSLGGGQEELLSSGAM